MEKVAQLTGLTPGQLSRYGLITGVIMVMLGIGNTYITCLLGVAYPVFMSFLALESEGEDDDKQWLTYWVVFGLFSIVDQFAGFVLTFIPFYFFMKLVFLVWLFHPATLGATTIYNAYILPNMEQYEKQINKLEDQITDMAGSAKSTMADAASTLKDTIADAANGEE